MLHIFLINVVLIFTYIFTLHWFYKTCTDKTCTDCVKFHFVCTINDNRHNLISFCIITKNFCIIA